MVTTTMGDPNGGSGNVPRRRSVRRTDTYGRAFAGSQRHLQTWVNERTDALSRSVAEALALDVAPSAFDWRSPLAGAKYREYRDGAFLRAVGLEQHEADLRGFWPKGGPVWDGLAVVAGASGRPAVVLVEAKSYPDEVRGSGCQATAGGDALRTIQASLAATAAWLGVRQTPAWLGALYQSANRLAHLCFLRERLGHDAYLVNVCFTGDRRRPTAPDEWMRADGEFRREMGLADAHTPGLATLILPAMDETPTGHAEPTPDTARSYPSTHHAEVEPRA